MTTSDQLDKLAEALSKAQGAICGATKDSVNPFFKSHYADLASVMDACRVPLSANGLAIIQAARSASNGVCVETLLIHASGQWINETLHIPCSKPDAQGIGSAITYARRYGLAAMVGVCPEDDDGNDAARKPLAQREPVIAASAEQVLELETLIVESGISDSTTKAWLAKAGVESFADMSQNTIQKCIVFLRNSLKKG